MALWGSGDYRNLSGESGTFEWDGDMTGAHLGVDARLRDDLLVGVSVSWLESEADYDDNGGNLGKGEHELAMTSVHPYIGWRTAELDWWATVGYGEGELEITPQDDAKSTSDLEMRTFGGGGSGWLLESEAGKLRLKGEAFHTTLDVDGDGSANFQAQEVDATRLRLAVEASRSRALDGGGLFEPSLEFGVRYDDGDGETGAGAEISGGLRYRNPATGVTAEGRVRALLGHSGDYEEWGIQGQLALQPGADGQGLSFSLSPGYGDTTGSDLWQQSLPAAVTDTADTDPTADYHARMDVRLGYGLSLRGRDGVLTPYSEMTLGTTDSYRLGLNWKTGTRFELNLLGERRESDNDPAEHTILLKGEMRF